MQQRTRRIPLMVLLLLVLSAGGPGVGAPPAVAGRAALPTSLLIIKRFGAALRQFPSSNAHIVHVLPCGQNLAVSGASGGWYRVFVGPYEGWVGGARVADAANPPAFSCTGAYTFQMGQHVFTHVKTGCLSLRVQPSRQAVYHYCVGNAHDYEVTNGPIAVGADDWFGVYSASTGGGWAIAQYLYAYR